MQDCKGVDIDCCGAYKKLLVAISFEKPGNLWHQRIVRIWVAQQGADGQQDLRETCVMQNLFGGQFLISNVTIHLAYGKSRGPLRPQDVETD